jgi:hypothetical protein
MLAVFAVLLTTLQVAIKTFRGIIEELPVIKQVSFSYITDCVYAENYCNEALGTGSIRMGLTCASQHCTVFWNCLQHGIVTWTYLPIPTGEYIVVSLKASRSVLKAQIGGHQNRSLLPVIV